MRPRPRLVLLPGMMCDERLFAPQIAALEPIADVWVGDMSRSGTIADLARDVLADCPFKAFALAGLSMGGIVAMEIVRQAPQRVNRLALLDTNHHADLPERRKLRAGQIAQARNGRLRQVLVEEMKPAYLAPANRADRKLRDLVLDMGLKLGPLVFERQSIALRNRDDAS